MRVATTVALALLPFVSLCWPRAAASTPHAVERTVYLMGTRARLVLLARDRAAGLRRLEAMVESLEQTEADLSTWRTDSVLSAINRQPVGKAFQLPPQVCALWVELTAWHWDTGGAFDPAIGSLIATWGLRAGGRHPSTADLAAAAA